MIPFITYREPNNNGEMEYYILQKQFPHYIGKISGNLFEKSLSRHPISKHNLYVVFSGTILGAYVPSYKNVMEEIDAVMAQMALWFYDNRILQNEKRFSKFKIKTDALRDTIQ